MFQNVKKYLSKSHSPRQQPLLNNKGEAKLDETKGKERKKKKNNCCGKKKKKKNLEPGHIYEVAQCVAAGLCLETRSIQEGGTAANGGHVLGTRPQCHVILAGVFDRKQQNPNYKLRCLGRFFRWL
ncbi:hypothetical protein CEXT_783211 [Caerostris extrusa]|uniref:Uncharacterized protein n=1 Tax=Caerostris extrusa TaxID=172846 RepID=A0AAV4XYL0_CAEEX|nr:hypothetical protein CEXT_783211 [Caerostris extrusa]